MRQSRLFTDQYELSATPDFDGYVMAGHVLYAHKATQGTYHIDKMHAARSRAAHDRGLAVMHYHFCDWTSPGGYKAEAGAFWRAVKPTFQKGDKLAIDFERAVTGMAAPNAVYIRELWQEVLRLSGHDARIYGSTSWLASFAPWRWLTKRARWQAQYGPNPRKAPWGTAWWAWQFTNGSVGPSPHSLAGMAEGDISMLRLDVALRIQAATARRRRRAIRVARQQLKR